jgi:WD40 repeat protein
VSGKSDKQTPGRERPPADSSGDFFSVGAPLHAVRAGYVRRRADDLLYEALVAGHYAHVIAPDRSGKSSLIAATAARLEANGFNVAILDLDQIGVRDAGSDAGRWYYSVAYRILRQLRIRFDLQSWWQDKAVLGNRQRLLEFYNEIVLQFVQERIVIFVDGVQCIEHLGIGDQLLSSIRSAHNARTTDPEFSRLAFVLLGECDPVSLIDEPELSPFNVTQAIPLHDFTRDDLNLFAAELNLEPEDAEVALDRIYYWTRGQPYLTQKLARATAREGLSGDIREHVDRIVRQQLTGRASLHNEPQLSHIHREILRDEKQNEALLNLYGRLRKGVGVATDLGSPLQRRLMAVGLLRVDDNGDLRVRNRVYEAVFTARWANENLPTRWRAPLVAVAAVLLILAVPFWYTQWLPAAYIDVLTSSTVEFDVAATAWRNLRSFPGHATTADNIYRNFLRARAEIAGERTEIETIATLAADLPQAGNLPNELRAAFWDRSVRAATRLEQRDRALLAALESLVLSTPQRRRRAAMLVGEDYPLLLASLAAQDAGDVVFDPDNLLLTSTQGSQVAQWSLTPQGLQQNVPWTMTALEVTPLVRRVIVDREGQVGRVGLTLNVSHPRLTDLRIKVIAPSGRAVEIETGLERASSNDDIRIPAAQMRDLVGEQLNGTWSLSVRDEALGVAGHLVGWNLTLNSQGVVEDFQRGLHIPDPVERDTDNFWISSDGRYAVARALQSDSARVWDLAFAKPVRAIAVGQNETLIGLDKGARRLVTATLETVSVWDTSTGDRIATMAVGAGSVTSRLTGDGLHLFVQRSGDTDTRLELWSLEDAKLTAQLDIAGSPALVALDSGGTRIAVADFDRAVRVWDFENSEMLAQLDLPLQPSAIEIAAGGKVLGVTYGESGVSLWQLDRPTQPMIEERGPGNWQLSMSPSGNSIVAGRPRSGYQIYRASDGHRVGPTLGAGGTTTGLLMFSSDERALLTGGPDGTARFWRVPTEVAPVAETGQDVTHAIWTPSGDAVVAATPDASGIVIGDRGGHVHSLPADVSAEILAAAVEDVSFLGHEAAIHLLAVGPDGRLAASAARDNTIRAWDLSDGRPLPYMASMPGGAVNALEFSPDASMLAVLSGTQVLILDARSGEVIVEFQPGEVHGSLAFADADHVYIGSESGALRVIARDTAGAWSLQQLWQRSAPIRWLRASPRGRFLVLVDQDNLAQQFSLAEGRVGELALSLPGAVEDVAFNPAGSRVFFRTARWIQRASSSANGLIWHDAIFGPSAMHGAGIVVGAGPANDVHVPVARAGTVSLHRLHFLAAEGPSLFGNKNELLREWRTRLGLATESATTQEEVSETQAEQPPG